MRLGDVARRLKRDGEKALVPFFTAGYPDVDTFIELVRSAERAGCDIIEIGIPFSDPIADGPLIQESSVRALENGMTLRRSLELATELVREVETPIVFMSYFNPILRMGADRFVQCAQQAGVAGVIVPDLSLEESETIRAAFQSGDIGYVDLIAPNSSENRIERIVQQADGFAYLVSVTGVTGDRSPEAHDIGAFVERVRRKTNLPLFVGFGISDSEKAASAVRHSDGVIIGSALIRMIKSSSSNTEAVETVSAFLREVKAALSNVSAEANSAGGAGGEPE